MSNKPAWMDRAPHGTDARARRHWRDGDKPLRQFCELCADATMIARQHRKDSRYPGAYRTAYREAA